VKPLDSFNISLEKCVTELAAFDSLLAKKTALDERSDVLSFFRTNTHLAAYIGSYQPRLTRFDRIGVEFTLFGDFRADLLIGDSVNHCHCLIEFEDANADSIFKPSARSTPDWSPRFEHGFGQLVDWFWKIDDLRQTAQGRSIFGQDTHDFMGVLVIGRDQFISPTFSTGGIDRARRLIKSRL